MEECLCNPNCSPSASISFFPALCFGEMLSKRCFRDDVILMPPRFSVPWRNQESNPWLVSAAATRRSSLQAARAPLGSMNKTAPCGCSRSRPTLRGSTSYPPTAGAPDRATRDRQKYLFRLVLNRSRDTLPVTRSQHKRFQNQ